LVISGPLEAGSLRRLPGSSARHDPGAPGPGPSVVANPEIGRNYRGVVASAVANRI